jgi:hypothetical protein
VTGVQRRVLRRSAALPGRSVRHAGGVFPYRMYGASHFAAANWALLGSR